ncbi:hypothetical protein Tco_1102345 [Tanacetum coccineum]
MTVAGAKETVGMQKTKKVKEPQTYSKEKDVVLVQTKLRKFMAKIQKVPTADSGTDTEPSEQVQNNAEYNVFANVRHHSEQFESTSNTCLMEKDDSNVTPDSPDMCDNDIQTDQNTEDERVALANLMLGFMFS